MKKLITQNERLLLQALVALMSKHYAAADAVEREIVEILDANPLEIGHLTDLASDGNDIPDIDPALLLMEVDVKS